MKGLAGEELKALSLCFH